ncbi:BCCT family transporter [Gephyromycinifex aptenodytis]|uniref:BCCT family transporter n=1 Tax=Gephyromycinifex aptenodytis TaxID=2716227 RepID=UPI001447FB7C|nr:BCCT family transporter [Gephyromycinifex aptenodytis]
MSSSPPPSSSEVQDEVSPDGPGRLYPRVFIPAAALIIAFVALAALAPTWLASVLDKANTTVVNGLGWYYVLLVTGFVVFCIVLGFSRLGDVRLGRTDDEEPEYGLFSWFSMLFAAGMGIGLVFWGVAEPLNHFAAPPPGAPQGSPAEMAQSAMTTTFLHWGLHAWAIYVVVGLSVAYAVHRKGRPVSIRWALEPLLGKHAEGWIGDAIDVVAIVGTLFGVATSLGFGVTQLAAGLSYLGIIEPSIWLLLGLIVIITVLAVTSVVSGLDKGIKWLSTGNLVLAGVLMLALLLLAPSPVFILREFVQNIGAYIQNFVGLSFRTMPYQGGAGETWLGGWTTYYWGWWISWSPFVGIFIARISRGRTVRQFVAGVLLVPTMLTFLWFSILGGLGLYRQVFGEKDLIDAEGGVDTNSSLFHVIDNLPASALIAGLFLILIVVFFVTSSDSGSFVVDMLANGGSPNPPVWSRMFWGVLEGAVAAVVLYAGYTTGELESGLRALQILAILVAAPFSLVMIAMCISTARALHGEYVATERRRRLIEHRELQQVIDDEDESGSTAVQPPARV